jgi:hypothetical protein
MSGLNALWQLFKLDVISLNPENRLKSSTKQPNGASYNLNEK